MNIKKIIIPLLLIILLASTIAFGSNIPLGPYFDDTYFDLSNSALILKVVPYEKGGLEADVSAYDGLIKIAGGATSNLKVKLDGAQAPTVNNDVDEGYVAGSRWVDVTNDKEYVCLDNTDGAAVWTETTGAAGGYTNLTSFVDQTAWRVFYSNTDGDVVELALGTDGQCLTSTGATSAPAFETPAGNGDMLKATYDTDEDSDIDVAAGGTEKSSWTQYCIPYLSGTTAFGEIPIGTDNYALTVNGATGYDWTHLQVYDAGLLSLAGLTYASDGFIKVTAEDTYAIRTIAEVKTDLAYQLSDMSDVGVTTPTNTYVLVADGDSWESRALVETDVSDLGSYIEDITGESIFDLNDVTADPNADKYAKWDDDPGELIWVDASGYTNLTSFVAQTAWRLFYSNTDGDVTELALGTDGQVLTSGGASVAPSFEDAGGAGEANTASNIGSEIEIFKQKDGVDLEFRTLKANSNQITVSVDGGEGAKTDYQDGYASGIIDWVNSSVYYRGQYWLTGSAYSMAKIKVRTYRVGSPGDIILEVKAVDGSHYPTGSVLATSTVNCDAITTDTGGEWVTFTLASPVSLSNSTEYSWYFKGASTDADNKIALLHGGDVKADSGFVFSNNSGSSWSLFTQYDLAFQTYAALADTDYIYFDITEENIKLDDLGTPDDNIDNDASTTAHGLMPKLPFSGDLLSTTTVAFNADADTTLYTVPTGKRCVLTHAIVVAAGDAGATTTLSIGANGAETDFIPSNTLSNLDAEFDTVILQPIPNTTPLKMKSYVAETVIEAQVASQSGAAGNTIYLFGILY